MNAKLDDEQRAALESMIDRGVDRDTIAAVLGVDVSEIEMPAEPDPEPVTPRRSTSYDVDALVEMQRRLDRSRGSGRALSEHEPTPRALLRGGRGRTI